jgi:hypothetical protein
LQLAVLFAHAPPSKAPSLAASFTAASLWPRRSSRSFVSEQATSALIAAIDARSKRERRTERLSASE